MLIIPAAANKALRKALYVFSAACRAYANGALTTAEFNAASQAYEAAMAQYEAAAQKEQDPNV